MNHYPTRALISAAVALLATALSLLSAAPLGTAFTYQGRLSSDTNAASGLYDVRFAVYDALYGGNIIGGPITNSAATVTSGYFEATLDLGNVFDGRALWLEIAVRTNGAAAFTTLTPRQALTPAPYALYSANAAAAASVPASGLTGTLPLQVLPSQVITNVPPPAWSNLTSVPMSLWDRADASTRRFSKPPKGVCNFEDYPYGLDATNALKIVTNLCTYGWTNAGYNYLVIDDNWYERDPVITYAPLRDATTGQLIPRSDLYPNGMAALASAVHALGCKLGIYMSEPMAQGGPAMAPEIDAETFCAWNLDYVKFDFATLTHYIGQQSYYVDYLQRFAKTMTGRCLTNNRPPLFLDAHATGSPYLPTANGPDFDNRVNTDPAVHMLLDGRREGNDADALSSYCFNMIMANGQWYSKVMPFGGVVDSGNDKYHSGSDWNATQSYCRMAMAATALMSGEMLISRGFSPFWLANFTNSPIYGLMPILTNPRAIGIMNDPAQAISQMLPISTNLTTYAWVKPLGSTKTPAEWAVAIVNDWNSGNSNTVTFHLDALPTLQGTVWVTNVWTGAVSLEADTLTATNLARGDCALYRVRPINLP
jgi:Alpha galactosidase A